MNSPDPSIYNMIRNLARLGYDARLGGYIASAMRFEKACEALAEEVGEEDYLDLVEQGQGIAEMETDNRKGVNR